VISLINPSENKEWLQFISQQQKATIFHHPAWLSVLHEQYGFNVFTLCAVDEKGTINAGIPFCEVRGITGEKRWVSLPFSDMCPPLSEDEIALNEVLGYCVGRKEAGQIQSVEIRYSLPEHEKFQKQTDAVIHNTKLTVALDELFDSFSKSQVQRGITKAQKQGLSVVISNDQSAVNEFYKLHLQTRRRLGVPIQPRRFFRIFFEQVIKSRLGFIVLVYTDSRCIAAGVFCGFGKVFTYKYGASDENYLRLRPNHLMFWTAMQEAVKRGYTLFDFGRTDADNQGLRKFKSGWGAVEVPLYYSYYPTAPHGKILATIKSALVAPVIKHSPQFVCRVTGELFYKYFA
jgi:CelD/BcsL family acetyltransferase involved in cellulose biosynthesis